MIRLRSTARCVAQASVRSPSTRLASPPHRTAVDNSCAPGVAVNGTQTRRPSSSGLKGLLTKDIALESQGFRAGAEVKGTCAVRSQVISDVNGILTGIWECSPGAFSFPKRPNTESIVILSGRVKLTDLDTGNVIELQKGDSAVLELGSSVRWEIFETVTKFFVIVKP